MPCMKLRCQSIRRTPGHLSGFEDFDNLEPLKHKGPKACVQKQRRKNVTPAVRAEKSRNAAKYRRDREAEEFTQLTELLPFDPEVVKHLDKGTILRLATCYLHMKQISKEGLEALPEEERGCNQAVPNPEILKNSPKTFGLSESDLMLEALDGFLIFVTSSGGIIYASDKCEVHLGIAQHELLGHGILEFIHTEDHREFVKQFRDKGDSGVTAHPALPSTDSPISLDDIVEVQDPSAFIQERTFYVRMKCHLPRPGTKTKQVGHLLTQWTGKLRVKGLRSKNDGYPIQGLVAIVRPLHTTPIIEIRLDGNMFMSRHDLDLRYTFCDPRIASLVGYEPRELIGVTAYQFHNPLDAQKIQRCHSNLIVKGTSVSKYYRFLGKTGDWVWMKTRATIIYNSCNEAQYVVCLNYVYSDEEGKRYQMLEEEQNGHPQPDGIKAFTTFTTHMGRSGQPSPCSSPSSGYDSDSPIHNPFHDNSTVTVSNETSPVIQQFQESSCTQDSGNAVTDGLFSGQPAMTSSTMTNTSPPGQPSPVYIDTMNQTTSKSDQLDNVFDLPYKEGLNSSGTCVPLTFDPSLDVDWLDKMANDLMEASGTTFTPTTRTAVFDHDYSVQPMDTQASIPDVSDLNDLLDSSLLDENLANNTFLNGTKTVGQSQESALLQLLGSSNGTGTMSSNRPVSVAGTMTVSAFPKHLTSTTGPVTNGSRSQQDFAIKFAENMVEQRMRQDMLNYLSEETDVLPCKTMSYTRDHSYTAPSSMSPPNTYNRLGKKSVPYSTANQSNHRASHSNGRNRRSTNSSRSNSPPTSPTKTDNKASTLLEAMLLTKEPLNPNKGSDEVFQTHKHRVTQGLSRLNIEEEQADGNLLKQLLTGEINDKQVHQYEQSIIDNRKRDDGDSGHPSDEEGDYPMLDLTFGNVVTDSRPQRTLNLELFDAETAGDMANLLGPISPDMEVLMRSEIDDILREQTRQDDLWLQQYL